MQAKTQLLLEANELESKIKGNMHLLHLILTLITGVWVFVWAACACIRKSSNDKIRKSSNDKIRARIRKLERQALMVES